MPNDAIAMAGHLPASPCSASPANPRQGISRPWAFVRGWALAPCLILGAYAAPAAGGEQRYPSQPIKLVTPAAPGGATDVFARKFANKLEGVLGVSIHIENKGGAGGTIGTADVVRAPADGYTLLMGTTGTNVINPLTMQVPFDPRKDLRPIAVVGLVPFCLEVYPGLGVHTVQQFIDLVKKHPNEYSYATNGPAGFVHLTTLMFASQAGLQMTAVPYKGGTLMVQDLITGRVPIYFNVLNGAIALHKSGQARILAVTGARRSRAMPDLPTVAESGLPGFESETAFILSAPAQTPQGVIDKLVAATRTVVADTAFQKDLDDMAVQPVLDSDPDKAAQFIRGEFVKWQAVVASVQRDGS
ncbi:tripartite tricarboxylate transporter substrate binding protein [Bordetella sp. BOR01]|uniref:Bug family tripartite tricarboxylate transporter substrate binding protein n=1 Tax=Bordetella sp. BOR01 TaxID=2854779 RepID=UPI001C43EC1A|nr:tripartite tricarboxylate transporter substrate binding protein [Bordetella sp. BOR01]MBV7483850.1 tripartite tricarboxylate transporter substrate binding protein [Bordetella sp. BOR01]